MDTESVALASTAAATMVTLLTTDAWTQVKKEVAGLWRRFRPHHATAVADDLDAARTEALAAAQTGDDTVARALTTEWQARLQRLLAADAGAAAELARVVATMASALERATAAAQPQQGNVTIEQQAIVTDQGTAIQIAGDGRFC